MSASPRRAAAIAAFNDHADAFETLAALEAETRPPRSAPPFAGGERAWFLPALEAPAWWSDGRGAFDHALSAAGLRPEVDDPESTESGSRCTSRKS